MLFYVGLHVFVMHPAACLSVGVSGSVHMCTCLISRD